MNNLVEFNFVADSAIKEGDAVCFKSGGCNCRLCEPITTSNLAQYIGVAAGGAAAGEAVTIIAHKAGQIVNVRVAGSVSAGNILAIGSSGVVASASGNYNLLLVADSAGSSGDVIPAVMVAGLPAAANT